jgi:tetratricopeptide (TPR) repeat protein
MKQQLQALAVGLLALGLLTGGNCSRARVKSMNQMNQGVQYARTKRYVQATKHLQQATTIDPTNDQAFYNLALVHIEMSKFNAAKEDLQQAISVNDKVAGYHEKLGTVEMELEEWDNAKEAFEKALKLDESLFKANFKLGQVHEHLARETTDGEALIEHQTKSLEHYTTAIEKGPRFLPAYQSLGRLYADLDYLDQSAKVLQSGLQVAPKGSDAEASLHHLLGTVYQQQKKFDKAIEQFRAALEIQPGNTDALFSVGWTYSLKDNREEARRFLKKFTNVAAGDTPEHYVQAARDKLNQLGEGP